MTKDNIELDIDSVVYYEIEDPYVAVYLVANTSKALQDRTQTTLRQVFGNQTLQECIEHRDAVAEAIKTNIDAAAHSWGVKVEAILIKDIILNKELRQNLSAAATQKRIGRVMLIG